MPDPAEITADSLREEGLDWLLHASFLVVLGPGLLAQTLAAMRWQEFSPGELMIEDGEPGRGAWLIVSGQCVVLQRGAEDRYEPRARLGPGHLVGERSLLLGSPTSARVVARSPVRALHLPTAAFRELLSQSKEFRIEVNNLVAVRDRSRDLLRLLLRNPALRSLGADEMQRLLQGARLERCVAGQTIVRRGEADQDVFMIVSGEASAYAPVAGADQPILLSTAGPGWLFGHAAALLNQPRMADVIISRDAEVLRIRAETFRDIAEQDSRLHQRLLRQVMSFGAITESPTRPVQARLVALYGSKPALGAKTLAYGVAAAIAERAPVVLLDLDNAGPTNRLGWSTTPETIAGIPVLSVRLPREGQPRVLWPRDRAQAPALARALRDTLPKGTTLIVSASTQARLDRELALAADSVVRVCADPEESWEVPDRRGQARLEVVRLRPGHPPRFATTAQTVRFPEDAATANLFQRSGDLSVLIDRRSALGRASRRVARGVEGRMFGLALGGGGAWGFGHIGLLRALDRANVDVDYIAGASFGALVAGVYSVNGMEGLEQIIRQRQSILARLSMAILSTRFLSDWVDTLVGSRPLSATEIPFLPVASDVISGRQVVISSGSVGDGVRSSSGFPGIFPHMQLGGSRLVDGGVVNNVPASAIWEAGADFVLASSVVPTTPGGRSFPASAELKHRLARWTIGRVDDLQRSVYLMMSQGARDRARLADFVFDAELSRWQVYDFPKGDAIAEEAEAQAEERMHDLLRTYTAKSGPAR